MTLIGKGPDDEQEQEGWKINAKLQRTSLRLVIQNDTVFILFCDAHGPGNIIEGYGRNMTKGK